MLKKCHGYVCETNLKECYICGTTTDIIVTNKCEQPDSTASVRYCTTCGDKYVNAFWREHLCDSTTRSWVYNENDFWYLFDGAKKLYESHEKIDPYKEHRKIEEDKKFIQWRNNQEKCALCGSNGIREDVVEVAISNRTITSSKDRDFMHFTCFRTVDHVSQLLQISFIDSLEKLKNLFSKPKNSVKKRETKIDCFADFSQNPWNR